MSSIHVESGETSSYNFNMGSRRNEESSYDFYAYLEIFILILFVHSIVKLLLGMYKSLCREKGKVKQQ